MNLIAIFSVLGGMVLWYIYSLYGGYDYLEGTPPPKEPTLEDGEIVSTEDGIFIQCPKCKQLTPRLIQIGNYLETVVDLSSHLCGTVIDVETGESIELELCDCCGRPISFIEE